ncbi:MAG: energy transducer TonB [Pseudomonadota bacterium]
MSTIFGLFLAATLTQATPSGPAAWLSNNDYPAGAKRRHEEGTVGFALLISQQGRIEKCSVTESSGFPELDNQTCAVVAVRAHFKPATDENRMAVYGFYSGRLTWRLPGAKGSPPRRSASAPPSDIELDVQRLPNDALEESIGVVTKIDPTGRVILCEPSDQKEGLSKPVAIACSQAKDLVVFLTKNDAGNPVTLIRNLRVTFKVAPK